LNEGTARLVVQMGKNRRALDQRIRVDRGDSLVLVFDRKDSGFVFRREMYYDSHLIRDLSKRYVDPQTPPGSPWVLSVLQNQRRPNEEKVQLMVTLEKREEKDATREDAIKMVRPKFVWYEVATRDKPTELLSGLRFYRLAGYPAPAYSLDLDSEPASAPRLY